MFPLSMRKKPAHPRPAQSLRIYAVYKFYAYSGPVMKVGSSSSFFDLRVVRSRSAKTEAAIANGAETEASQAPFAEHLKDWHEERSNGVSASNSKTKQAALDKAAILKRRLEMLKAMLLFASPEVAKSIARQLKGIASELASLGKNVGGNSSASATLAVPGTMSAASETTSATASAEAGTDEAVAPTAADPARASSDAQQSDAASDDDVAGEKAGNASAKSGESTPKSDDGALRKAIDEAKHLLKQVILGVKAKLKEGEEEARRDLQTAENSLAELDRALAQEASAGLYTAGGGLTAELGAAELSLSSALAGASVDVSA